MNTRDKFHAWLVTLGYRDDIKPLPSGSYNSENVDALWGCWQAAIASVEADHKEAIWQAQVDASEELA